MSGDKEGVYETVSSDAQCDEQLMLHRRLAGIDLNLLIALDALLDCRNVTHAARKLGQTQPAMSRSLARLRDILGDDLLVRSSSGLKLTGHGEYLSTIVPSAMLHIRDLMSSRQEAETRLSISGALAPAVLPHFLKFSSRENESFKLSTHRSTQEGLTQLRLRTADFALGALPSTEADIVSEIVAEEEFVTLVASKRQNLGGIRPTSETYMSLQQIVLIENGQETFPQLGAALGRHGISRSALVEIPDVSAAALMVSESDLALTVPLSIASWLTKSLRLAALVPPVTIEKEKILLAWLNDSLPDARHRIIFELKASVRDAIAHEQGSVNSLQFVE